jgi:hypothetical protein
MIDITKQEIEEFVQESVQYFTDQMIYLDSKNKLCISEIKEIRASFLEVLVCYDYILLVIPNDKWDTWIYDCECPVHPTEGKFHTEECQRNKQQEYESWVCTTIEKKIKRKNQIEQLQKLIREFVE